MKVRTTAAVARLRERERRNTGSCAITLDFNGTENNRGGGKTVELETPQIYYSRLPIAP
jgi:hypothetical protein